MNKKLIITVLILGILSLFMELAAPDDPRLFLPVNILDFAILLFSLADVYLDIKKAGYKTIYLRRNFLSLLFLTVFIIFFTLSKISLFSGEDSLFSGFMGLIVFRNFFMVMKIFSRFKKASSFLQSIAVHPSQTLVLSFLMVILLGTLLLSMPFSAADQQRTPILDSLFTATSAVCVTGLIVVDTPVHFSFWGQFILLLLIQIGGLGIMLLSFATLFLLRREVSFENKILISHMVNEEDMSRIQKMILNITGSTFLIELAGAVILFFALPRGTESVRAHIFSSIFHAVSAFCNAGFALFSDSLESLAARPAVLLTIALLIILGGFSFAALADISGWVKSRIKNLKTGGKTAAKLQVNTRIVITYSVILIALGMLFFYSREHGASMKTFSLGKQYLSAFFQSVTLRTAGFNSVPFGILSRDVLFFMLMLMFIGGASGSTAGGIKINTLAVMAAYLRSFWRREKGVTLYAYGVNPESIYRAFSILVLGLTLVLLGTLVLSITESASFLNILFETVSAFGTVGLSTGITAGLSVPGKVVIILLMFAGRLGPLTIVSAAGPGKNNLARFNYPGADIAIG